MSSIIIDSRIAKEGDLFIAIKGENFDGNDFAASALAKGAKGAVLSSQKIYEQLKVEYSAAEISFSNDGLAALTAMARQKRDVAKAKFIAITGSVGKTTAKEMTNHILQTYGKSFATKGNLNNHIGLPLTLCNLPNDADYVVLELGMSHAGEISYLAEIAKPHIAVITAISHAHSENFSSLAGLMKAKAEIFTGLPKDRSGIAIIPSIDSEFYEELRIEALLYCDKILPVAKDLFLCDDYVYQYNANIAITTAAAVLGINEASGIKELALHLKNYHREEGRGGTTHLAANRILMDDSYNASPSSMKAAIARIKQLKTSHKLAKTLVIIGDMKELGDEAERHHRDLLGDLNDIDIVITVGDMMSNLGTENHFSNFTALTSALKQNEIEIPPDSATLVKGSHSMKLDQVAALLRFKYSR